MAQGDWPSAAETRYTAALWRMYRSIVGEWPGLAGCISILHMTSSKCCINPICNTILYCNPCSLWPGDSSGDMRTSRLKASVCLLEFVLHNSM
jgi:hypothetical protein